jgi:hypothetical protein
MQNEVMEDYACESEWSSRRNCMSYVKERIMHFIKRE